MGVSQDAFFALLNDGQLLSWQQDPDTAKPLMAGVVAFASGQSGWFAIDHARVLWLGGGKRTRAQRVAGDVVDACIGDSADYVIRHDGSLWAWGEGFGITRRRAPFVCSEVVGRQAGWRAGLGAARPSWANHGVGTATFNLL